MTKNIFQKIYHLWLYLISKSKNAIANFTVLIYNVERTGWIHGNGMLHFYTFDNSVIHLGANFRYNSNSFYNRYGVRNSCYLSTLQYGAKLVIGNNVGMSGVYISAFSKITISDNVLIGSNTIITDSDWHPKDALRRFNGENGKTLPVHIGENVWIGANVQIFKGVTIGSGTIVGAGSVLFDSFPSNVIVKGNPAVICANI